MDVGLVGHVRTCRSPLGYRVPLSHRDVVEFDGIVEHSATETEATDPSVDPRIRERPLAGE